MAANSLRRYSLTLEVSLGINRLLMLDVLWTNSFLNPTNLMYLFISKFQRDNADKKVIPKQLHSFDTT